MHYSRKITIAAFTGVAIAVAASLNRSTLNTVFRGIGRRQRLLKLKAWYVTQRHEIRDYAGIEVDRYLIGQRDALLGIARQRGHTGEAVDVFLKTVGRKARRVIIANHYAQLTKKYGEYLYDVDTNRAFDTERAAKWWMQRAAKLADRMREYGYPVNSLFISLRITPPN